MEAAVLDFYKAMCRGSGRSLSDHGLFGRGYGRGEPRPLRLGTWCVSMKRTSRHLSMRDEGEVVIEREKRLRLIDSVNKDLRTTVAEFALNNDTVTRYYRIS